MSWPLASMLILGIALGIGFAWYERTRPSARVLALVAALAALAVVGRLAFAAFPNVKPTTDIVLFAGYALGGAPGFAVGALTALTSNIFLTQGPWTPWQMAAWGGVGLAGAGLARLTPSPSRLTLALVCGVAGFAFGALMDVYQWSFTAEQTLASYLAISATSFPYNLAHALGNVVFALAIGPAFLRALRRYRLRFDVRWAVVPAATLLLLAAPASASVPVLDRATRYLESAQNPDGGFGPAPRQSSTQLHTGWTALGLGAVKRNPREVERGGRSLIDYMRAGSGGLRDVGEIERTILVLRAAGVSPRSFAGRDLLAELRKQRESDGSVARRANHTAFGVLAFRAAGLSARAREVRSAASWLLRQQNTDGGWGFGRRGGASDVDDTGAVLQALAAAGRGGRPVDRAVKYLRGSQNPDGGFGQMRARSSNAQSTAWAVQGLVAARRDPEKVDRGGRNPVEYLISLQNSDGSIRYSRTSRQTPVWVTAQALTALAKKAFPLAPVARRSAAVARVAAAAPEGKEKKKQAGGRKKKKKREPKATTNPVAPPPLGTSEPEIERTTTAPPVRSGVPASAVAPGDDDEGGSGTGTWIAVLVAASALSAAAALWLRSRRA